jgi:hypothetical protein
MYWVHWNNHSGGRGIVHSPLFLQEILWF